MDYKDVFNYFGYQKQRRKLVEEVNEFTDEVLLFENGRSSKKKMIEELADITIVLQGFIKKYELDNELLHTYIKEKKERLDKRIEIGYY